MTSDENGQQSFHRRVTEVMLALDVACVLSFIFMDKVGLTGKISLCQFSSAIPILAAALLDKGNFIPNKYLPIGGVLLEVLALAASAVAFGMLIFEIFGPAGWCLGLTFIVIAYLRLDYYYLRKFDQFIVGVAQKRKRRN
jgi:hypothetical protein